MPISAPEPLLQVSGLAPPEPLFLVKPGHELLQYLHHVRNRIRRCWRALLGLWPFPPVFPDGEDFYLAKLAQRKIGLVFPV